MAQVESTDMQMQADELYREETITDRRVGSIRRLTPIKVDGSDDAGREVLYVGQAQLMTPMGAIPLSFDLKAESLSGAVEKFPDAAQEAVERTAKELEEMRREASSSIYVPGSGGSGGIPGGGVPGGGSMPGTGGGGIQM
ncbi:MAG: hypothetical protein MAG794_01506 [Gammaproteobacteria bacterium]|nr:hypothetical protein [Gammaproteobacteria bacterium]